MPKITIDTEQCIGCCRCAIICDMGVLDLADDHHPVVIDFEKCNVCGKCERECLENAIAISA
jgi:NAD-dependent dihydropyrimidine dehydrogenase PreA subunit